MPDKELLSQEEIDALLSRVSDDEDEDYFHDGQPRPFDFNSQDRIVRGNMPTLEMINERFAREFRITLFQLLRRNCQVTDAGIKIIKFGEYLQRLLVPSSLNVTKVRPLKGSALFV